ncbi:tetratricopeptide repeat protein [Agarilytica rhodophyticola]|uniref:tetratricopeptide repeat protein n=1 Tax=Agarilytica rhodophyticola TaxID=1737490 RepID=UPI000B347FC8|nr:tetratricopeptide repeat protein [Agarilytica rhodophyticola]
MHSNLNACSRKPAVYRWGRLALAIGACLCLLSACETSTNTVGPTVTTDTRADASGDNNTSTPNQELSELSKSQYHTAFEQMQKQEYKVAQKILRKLASQYSQNLAIKTNLATVYFKQGNIKEAEQICQQALSKGAKIEELYNLLGLISVENKKFQDAENYYRKALSLNKNYADAHHNLALLYDVYYQDINNAYQHYAKYLSLAPEDEEVKQWLEQLKYSLDQE